MTRYLVPLLLLTAIFFLSSPAVYAQNAPSTEQLDSALRSCAGQKKIDVDADVSGAIKEAWEGNVLRGKAKIDQFGQLILSFKDETLRLKAYELYTKCLKDYLDTFSRGQHSQTSKQQKTAYDFNGCWQADDTQDKRFIEAKSDKIFKVWSYNSYGKPYACLGEEVEVHVDVSNHVVMKRRECPESDDRMTEAYFEKDDVLRIVRTIQSNGVQKPQGQRLIRLLRLEECPQPPPHIQKSPPKVSLRNVDTERFREFATSLHKRAARGANTKDEAKGWKDEYNNKIHEAKLVLKQCRYIRALQPIAFVRRPKTRH